MDFLRLFDSYEIYRIQVFFEGLRLSKWGIASAYNGFLCLQWDVHNHKMMTMFNSAYSIGGGVGMLCKAQWFIKAVL